MRANFPTLANFLMRCCIRYCSKQFTRITVFIPHDAGIIFCSLPKRKLKLRLAKNLAQDYTARKGWTKA